MQFDLKAVFDELLIRLDQIALINGVIETLPKGCHKAHAIYLVLSERTGLTNSAANRRQFSEALILSGWKRAKVHQAVWWSR